MKRPWPTREACLAGIREGTGEGVTVAILDTGIDAGHPDLAKLDIVSSWRVGEQGFEPSDATDPAGHGTGIAGIIHRLAPRARVINLVALEASRRQRRHQTILEAAGLALDHGAGILNCSFGVPGTSATLPLYKAWTEAAHRCGALVVAASSNEDPALPEWPAHFAHVLGVAAADLPTEALRFRARSPIPFEASGFEVETPAPGGHRVQISGSSFAAAHVTALSARLLSALPGLPPAFVREALIHHSTTVGE